ncbi:rubrerythrin-like domain-containing protein [Halalkalicoccus tibetensis]|uniref:Rubrerythrin-like domain-containing protein n=1 Tax=Halalkalicoccus tibetensis TaxID=175632 RepID=A0ABD5V968_9EURY
MKDSYSEPDGKRPYECFNCGTICVKEKATSCPNCGGQMRNRLIPLE